MKITTKIVSGFIVIAGLVFGSTAAQAGFLLEPYLGYHLGKTKGTDGEKDDTKGTTFGGRIGYTTLGFMGGLDYMTGKWATKDDTSENDVTPTDISLFVGYNFPVMVRAYLAYGISSKATLDSTPELELEGSAIKLGLGITTLPVVSINLEYITQTYDKAKSGGSDATLSSDIVSTMYGITISAPFDL